MYRFWRRVAAVPVGKVLFVCRDVHADRHETSHGAYVNRIAL